ncbi:hypothetical protein E3P77_03725 [Wallemia ichthyophaga]|nr:hypothetical protein E3P77_03725 [Wallemia ichthyophaga]
MNTIEYLVQDLSKIKFRLDFISEVNILTISDAALPLCEFTYYELKEKLIDTLRYPHQYDRIISFNKRIDNYCLARHPRTMDLEMHVNASKSLNNFYTNREGRIVRGEDYYKIHTDINNIKLIGRLPKLPALATSRRLLERAQQAKYLRYYLNNVALPSFKGSIGEAFLWLNITLLRFSELRYNSRVRRMIDEYRPPESEEEGIPMDLALHQWRGGLLDSGEVYDYLTKLPTDLPLFIQIKGFSHSPSAWCTYKEYRRFHSQGETPTQNIVCMNGKVAVCDEYSINKFK